ncbi:MAG: hypothetical protein COB65_14125, partial [Thalassobium sp.]
GWGTPGYNTSFIPNLSNGDRLPVMFSINCSSGELLDPACFAEQMIRHNNGGAVGVIAASNISYSGLNDAFALGMFDAIWANPGLVPNFTGSGGTGNPPAPHSDILRMGDVLNQGLLTMATTWSASETTNQLFHYHGDPAMKIWTDVPTQITASVPTLIQCQDTSITITSSTCANGLATVCFNGELIGSIQLIGGTGTIDFLPVTNIVPHITVTISQTNFQPLVVDVPIVNCALPPDAIFSASSVSEIICGGITPPVIMSDLSYYGPTQWQWSFIPNTVTYTNSTNSNSQNPEVIFNAPGIYAVQLVATNIYGDDTTITVNYIDINEGATLPLMEDFENGLYPPEDWSVNNPDNNYTWESIVGNIGNGTSNHAARIKLYSYTTLGEQDELISPTLDFVSTPNPMLEFKISYRQFASYEDELNVLISTDCGATYQNVYSKKGANLVTTTNAGSSSWTPSTANDWRKETIDLSSYGGNTVLLKFQSINQYGNNLYLDDINIYSASALPETDFVASDTLLNCQGTNQTVYFTDLSQYSAANHVWTITPTTFNYLNGTNANSSNPTVTFNSYGFYQVSLTTSNTNGADTETKTSYIEVNQGSVLPLIEGFETSTGIPGDWTVENPDNSNTWTWNNSTSGNGSSTASVYMDFWTYPDRGERDAIITPTIDLTAIGNATLGFNVAHAQYSNFEDSLLISISTDCGSTFDTPIYIKGSTDLASTTTSGVFTPTSATDWRQELIDISAYAGNEIKIKFESITDFGNNLYLDDINIYYTSVIATPEIGNDISIKAYPNPTSGMVHLNLTNIPSTDFKYALSNVVGQTIIPATSISKGTSSVNLDLSMHASGVYLVRIYNGSFSEVVRIILD